jgi:hypothetical protein
MTCSGGLDSSFEFFCLTFTQVLTLELYLAHLCHFLVYGIWNVVGGRPGINSICLQIYAYVMFFPSKLGTSIFGFRVTWRCFLLRDTSNRVALLLCPGYFTFTNQQDKSPVEYLRTA